MVAVAGGWGRWLKMNERMAYGGDEGARLMALSEGVRKYIVARLMAQGEKQSNPTGRGETTRIL